MRTAIGISDVYMPVLLNFSNVDKLNVIARLAASLKEDAKMSEDDDFLNCFSGNWENEKSTADVVAEYRDNSYSDSTEKIEW